MAYSIEQLKSVVGAEGGLAKSNLFAIQLPSIPNTRYSGSSFNILTKNVTLPARQINTADQSVQGYKSKIGNGSITDDISITFMVTNSMAVKEYFEAWMKMIWNPDTRRTGYFKDYAKPVQIKVLAKPSINTTFKLPGTDKIPARLRGLVPDISVGAFNASLASGTINLDIGLDTTQTITLENAYPFTMNPIEMANDSEGFMELTISFTYSEWYSEAGLGKHFAGLLPPALFN